MSADWSAAQYLRFEDERTQPSRDLAAALPLEAPRRILDAGCGPGNSTRVLAGRFPAAELTGADSSPNMLEAAREALPEARFITCDLGGSLEALGGGYDLVFSNACLQWVPGHTGLIPRLLGLLRPGGVLAVQVPVQSRTHVHSIIGALTQQPPWKEHIREERVFYTLSPGEYHDLLAQHAAGFRMWQTTYYHALPSHEAILDWYRGTGLRPYLAALPEAMHAGFEAAILEEVKAVYPMQADGRVLYPFPRFFFTAQAAG